MHNESAIASPVEKKPKKTKKVKVVKKSSGPSKCTKLRELFKSHKDATPAQRQAYGEKLGLAKATVNTQFSLFNKGK